MVLIRKRKIHAAAIQYHGKSKRKVISSRPFHRNAQEQDKASDFTTTPTSSTNLTSYEQDPVSSLATAGDAETQLSSCTDVKTRYETVKEAALQDWRDLRDALFNTYISSQCPSSDSVSCQDCGAERQLFRCIDCLPNETVCEDCLQERHQHPHLHIFEIFQNEAFVPWIDGICNQTPKWLRKFHQCDTTYMKEIVIVDEKGRQHIRNVQFCQCEKEAVTLIRYRLWPSSTKFPKLAFHFELLKWLNGFLMECHVSVKGFCDALKARCSKHDRRFINWQGD